MRADYGTGEVQAAAGGLYGDREDVGGGRERLPGVAAGGVGEGERFFIGAQAQAEMRAGGEVGAGEDRRGGAVGEFEEKLRSLGFAPDTEEVEVGLALK